MRSALLNSIIIVWRVFTSGRRGVSWFGMSDALKLVTKATNTLSARMTDSPVETEQTIVIDAQANTATCANDVE